MPLFFSTLYNFDRFYLGVKRPISASRIVDISYWLDNGYLYFAINYKYFATSFYVTKDGLKEAGSIRTFADNQNLDRETRDAYGIDDVTDILKKYYEEEKNFYFRDNNVLATMGIMSMLKTVAEEDETFELEGNNGEYEFLDPPLTTSLSNLTDND